MIASENKPALISVIIPTFRRPVAVRLAALSALQQSWPEVEVIVVSDGPDAATRESLSDLSPRLRYLELDRNQGPAAARNQGALVSRGQWLAFLDDDDTMLPERLARQMEVADASEPHKMIACRMWYRHGNRQDLWPKSPLKAQEDVADYLLVRPSLLGRPGVISIQSLLVHRSVVERVPFTSHAEHEDWAWLLDAWHRYGARVAFVWEPLIVYNIDVKSASRSRRPNWRDSLQWAKQYREFLSDRAYCSFLATKVALKAKRAGDRQGLQMVVKELISNHPRFLDLLFVTGIVLLPGPLIQGAWRRSLQSTQGGTVPEAVQG